MQTIAADPLRQAEARRYQRARRRLEAAQVASSLALALGAALLAGWLASTLATSGPLVVDVAAFVIPLGIAAELLQLPLSLTGWRLSRRAGLSRQRLPGWLLDRAKGLVLAGVFGIALASGLVWLQRELPDGWWAAAAASAVAVEVVLATVAPVLILPLFLRSRPLPPGPLREQLLDLASAAGVRVAAVRVLEAGAKTSAANAFVTGFGPTRRIMLFDTLLGERDEPDAERLREAKAILGHELGHHRSRDLWRFVALSAATTLAAFAFADAALGVLPSALAHGGPGSISGLPAFALAIGMADAVLGVFTRAYSRRRERAADAFGIALVGDAEAFARAMERLCSQNLSELDPPRAYVALRMSHPAPRERIDTARAGAAA